MRPTGGYPSFPGAVPPFVFLIAREILPALKIESSESILSNSSDIRPPGITVPRTSFVSRIRSVISSTEVPHSRPRIRSRGGVAAFTAARLAPPALSRRRRWARGALAPRVRIATQHPYSRSSRARSPGVLGLRLVCVLDVGSIFRSPTRRRCAPCSAALAPHWAPPYGL